MEFKNILNSSTKSTQGEDEGWVKVNEGTWVPERPGDTIEGELVEKKFNVGKWNHNLYVIRLSDGRCRDVWGCYRLDRKMDEVLEGTVVRIRYKGDITKSDGEFMYDYEVLKKKE